MNNKDLRLEDFNSLLTEYSDNGVSQLLDAVRLVYAINIDPTQSSEDNAKSLILEYSDYLFQRLRQPSVNQTFGIGMKDLLEIFKSIAPEATMEDLENTYNDYRNSNSAVDVLHLQLHETDIWSLLLHYIAEAKGIELDAPYLSSNAWIIETLIYINKMELYSEHMEHFRFVNIPEEFCATLLSDKMKPYYNLNLSYPDLVRIACTVGHNLSFDGIEHKTVWGNLLHKKERIYNPSRLDRLVKTLDEPKPMI